MNIKEFTKRFYPSEEDIEKIALCNFVDEYVQDIYNNTAVKNALLRSDITSISDLANATYDEVSLFRNIGKKKLDYIVKLKTIIDENLNPEH